MLLCESQQAPLLVSWFPSATICRVEEQLVLSSIQELPWGGGGLGQAGRMHLPPASQQTPTRRGVDVHVGFLAISKTSINFV
jgi:hypothetical protein